MEKLSLQVPIVIDAPAKDVWDGLTNPAMVEQYFFGTKLDTDWKKGSPIRFHGEWEGKSYEDKGTILDITPGKRVSYTYWSSMSQVPDLPENYVTITYELSSGGEASTLLTVTQDGIDSQEKKDHSADNWRG